MTAPTTAGRESKMGQRGNPLEVLEITVYCTFLAVVLAIWSIKRDPTRCSYVTYPAESTTSMSGVEVAGFVLAAFPLAISALEHYRQTAETLGVFWKIRREYKTWTHSLDICRLAFEQNLEEFLLPLITDEDELQRLIAEPDGVEWKNPELEKRLRQRLPRSYNLYLESIDRIKDVMNDLKHELGIDKASFQTKVSENDVCP